MRLRAPAGTHSFSHQGEIFTVGEDNMVDVPDDVVMHMQQVHGFMDPAKVVVREAGEAADLVTIPRDTVLEMLSLLGVGVPGGMTDEALVQALRAAVRDLAGAPAEGDSPQEQDAEDDVEDEEEPAEQASPAAQDPPPAPQQAPQPTPQPQQQPSVRSRVRR